MKTLTASLICTCLAFAATGVAAQQKAAPMTEADCKAYAAAVAKDPKMKNADKDAQCKALADKGKAPAAPAPAKK